MEKRFETELLENNWFLIRHDHGYDYFVKTTNHVDNSSKKLTVVIDNFSVSPIGIYDYDLKDIVLKNDDDLALLYQNEIVVSGEIELSILDGILDKDFILDVYNLIREYDLGPEFH